MLIALCVLLNVNSARNARGVNIPTRDMQCHCHCSGSAAARAIADHVEFPAPDLAVENLERPCSARPEADRVVRSNKGKAERQKRANVAPRRGERCKHCTTSMLTAESKLQLQRRPPRAR